MQEKQLEEKLAKQMLQEGYERNPGPWTVHSETVAQVAKRLAKALGLEEQKAYIYGLIHDIGRREGRTGVRHIIDGYYYLNNLGYAEEARYCLTHSYFVKDVYSTLGEGTLTKQEVQFIQQFLENTEYTLYDKIIQIADGMALPGKITMIERRLIDVYLRYGIRDGRNEITRLKAVLKLQQEIEELLGCSIYQLFPEVLEDIQTQKVGQIYSGLGE